MTKIYKIFLPSHTHEDEEIGEIHYEPTKNLATLKLHNQPGEQQFYSPFAALDCVRIRYPQAYAE